MSRVSKASIGANGFGKLAGLLQLNASDGSDDELGNAHPRRDREVVAPVIDQQDLHFTAIVAVDRPGRIQYGDAMLARESRSRPDLCFESCRQRHRESAGHERELAGSERERFFNCRRKIEAGRAAGCILRDIGEG